MASPIPLLSKFVLFIVVIFIFIHLVEVEGIDNDDGEQAQLFEHSKHYSYDYFDNADLNKASIIASTSLSCFLSATTDFITDVQTNGFNPKSVAAVTIILLFGYLILGTLLSVKKTRYTSKQIQKPKKFNALIATAVALINKRRDLFASKENDCTKSGENIPLPSSPSFKSKKNNQHQQQNVYKLNDNASHPQQQKHRSISRSSKKPNTLFPYPVVKKVKNKMASNETDFSPKTQRNRASRAGIVTMTRTSSPSPSTMSTSPSSVFTPNLSPVENETILTRNQLIKYHHNDDLKNDGSGIVKESDDTTPQSLSKFSSAVMEHALENKYDSISPIFYDYFSEPIASVTNPHMEDNSSKPCNDEAIVSNMAPFQSDAGCTEIGNSNDKILDDKNEANHAQPIRKAKDTEFNACSSVLRSLSLFEDEETFEFDA